jgi:hypothetical protein
MMALSNLNVAVGMSSLAPGKNNNPHVGQGEFTGSGCRWSTALGGHCCSDTNCGPLVLPNGLVGPVVSVRESLRPIAICSRQSRQTLAKGIPLASFAQRE